MDEVDRGVGLEQVAPGPLARVRLAGDQKHPQPLAHAHQFDGRAVVRERQFGRAGRRLDLQHIASAVGNLELDLGLPPDLHA